MAKEAKEIDVLESFTSYVNWMPYAGLAISIIISIFFYFVSDETSLAMWLYCAMPFMIHLALYIPLKIILKKGIKKS
ncbi:hypothetical protein G7081_01460 [Vagococcus coleopterorum]|uniref:Uncharacterized protein n=1 Tax=Vagococcus coleopterorum TaxID=2714946 RepID=A0A6G8ALL3_9ENTE|nr:hypothetical protein [Vagococcus coleopterorum]QIL45849.1 hypothetical protein G7081_01460 [Vagococcus coleopterorum]